VTSLKGYVTRVTFPRDHTPPVPRGAMAPHVTCGTAPEGAPQGYPTALDVAPVMSW
jgi:hypothetical protein